MVRSPNYYYTTLLMLTLLLLHAQWTVGADVSGTMRHLSCSFYRIESQPPSTLDCNPYSYESAESSNIYIPCDVQRVSRNAGSFDVRWFKRALNGTVTDLGRMETKNEKEDRIEIRLTFYNLICTNRLTAGEYWCQVINTTTQPYRCMGKSNVMTLQLPDQYPTDIGECKGEYVNKTESCADGTYMTHSETDRIQNETEHIIEEKQIKISSTTSWQHYISHSTAMWEEPQNTKATVTSIKDASMQIPHTTKMDPQHIQRTTQLVPTSHVGITQHTVMLITSHHVETSTPKPTPPKADNWHHSTHDLLMKIADTSSSVSSEIMRSSSIAPVFLPQEPSNDAIIAEAAVDEDDSALLLFYPLTVSLLLLIIIVLGSGNVIVCCIRMKKRGIHNTEQIEPQPYIEPIKLTKGNANVETIYIHSHSNGTARSNYASLDLSTIEPPMEYAIVNSIKH